MVDQAHRARRRLARGRDDRGLGPHVQGQHRRPARLAGARDRAPAPRGGCDRAGLRPRRGGAGRRAGARARDRFRPVRGVQRRPGAGGADRVGRVPVDGLRPRGRDVADSDRARHPQHPGPGRAAPAGLHLRRRRSASDGPPPPSGHRRPPSPRVVSGVAGFLGSHLAERLVDAGLGRRRPRQPAHRSAWRTSRVCSAARSSRSRTTTSRTSCTSPGAVDAVLHFASPASPVDYLEHPIKTMKVGSLGTHNMLGLSLAKGARFFLASTSEVYGDPQVHPQPEDYWGHVNPVGPRGVYDEAKRFAEALALAYHRSHGLDVAHRAHLQHLRPAAAARPTAAWCRTSSCRRCAGEPLTVYGDGKQTAVVLLRRRRDPRPRSRCSSPTTSARSTSATRTSSRSSSSPRRSSTSPARRRRSRSSRCPSTTPRSASPTSPWRRSCSAGRRRSSSARASSARTRGTAAEFGADASGVPRG